MLPGDRCTLAGLVASAVASYLMKGLAPFSRSGGFAGAPPRLPHTDSQTVKLLGNQAGNRLGKLDTDA